MTRMKRRAGVNLSCGDEEEEEEVSLLTVSHRRCTAMVLFITVFWAVNIPHSAGYLGPLGPMFPVFPKNDHSPVVVHTGEHRTVFLKKKKVIYCRQTITLSNIKY